MKAAMVVKFTTPFPGRERLAIAYGREADEFFEKKAADGFCTEPKWFFAPTGESLWFVEGEDSALLGILAMPETQKLLAKGPIIMQDFGYGLYRFGREEMFGLYEEVLSDLKIH